MITLKSYNNERHLNILEIFVVSHDFDNKVLDVRRNRLFANSLDELAEFQWQTLLAL